MSYDFYIARELYPPVHSLGVCIDKMLSHHGNIGNS
jgi:hypothetical protein